MKAVVFFCVLVFLNFAVMRSAGGGVFSSGKKQEINALQNLLGKGTEETELVVSKDCQLYPDYKEFSTWSAIKKNRERYIVKGNSDIPAETIGIQIIPKDMSCLVVLDNSKNTIINVIPKSKPEDNDNQAFFLLQVDNTNTFMFLDPTRAEWFFTSPLGGCDIFVAIDQNNPSKPLVIHSNMNKIKNYNDNIEAKGNAVDMIMKFAPGYKLKARVYHKSPDPTTQKKMEMYGKTHDIDDRNIVFYDAISLESEFLFFGYYSNSAWQFYLKKEQKGGETEKVWPKVRD